MSHRLKGIRPNYLIIIAMLALSSYPVISARKAADGEISLKPNISYLPLSFSGWEGYAMSFDKLTLEMLQPDGYIHRNYANTAGDVINLTVVYGHGKSNFHSPSFCFLGGGWSIAEKDKTFLEFERDGRSYELEMVKLVLQKSGHNAVVLYTFLSPDSSTSNWTKFQTKLLFARLLGRNPRGALLRIVIPADEGVDVGQRVGEGFLREAFPMIQKSFDL